MKKIMMAGFLAAIALSMGMGAHAAVTFPIAELGNCGSKEECRVYCNETANIERCTAFGRANGLVTAEEARRAEQFKRRLEAKQGPGGCTTPESCRAFCSEVTNIEVCLKFAKEQGVKDKHVEQGEKILRHLSEGGTTPGRCNSKESCEMYCRVRKNADVCRQFAERMGLIKERRMDAPGSSSTEVMPERMRGEAAPQPRMELPQGILECIKKSATTEDIERLMRGSEPNAEVRAKLQTCFETLRPAESTSSRVTPGLPQQGIPSSRLCTDPASCKKLCEDPEGQFFDTPDCKRFRDVAEKLEELRQGEFAPDPANFPQDHACPDMVACAARCTNEESPYFLKPECVKYREDNPTSGSRTQSLFWGNIYMNFKAILKGGAL